VVIDLPGSHIWDASTVAALDTIETKYQALGKTVEILGMHEGSQRMQARLTGGFE
jgi:SulP family sulfate permease